MAEDPRSDHPAVPLVLALGSPDVQQFVIIEDGRTDTGRRQTPHAYGPMREDRLRAVLATDFGMEREEIERRVNEARQHLRER